MPGHDSLELHHIAMSVAAEAGGLLLDGWSHVRAVGTKSSPTDVVTQMDRASEELIVRRVLDQRPDDGVLGEEGGARPGRSGVRWIVDPLDGTVNYLYGIPAWAVAVGVECDGELVAGAVAVPAMREIFGAARGGGARRWTLERGSWTDPVALRSSGVRRLDQAMVATGFGYEASVRARQARVLPALLPAVRDIRRVGAAAVDICWVASGRVDAYFETGCHEWDLAAATVIAQEAGAVVRGYADKHPGIDGVIVADAELAVALDALLAESR